MGRRVHGIDACRRGWVGIELCDGRFADPHPTKLLGVEDMPAPAPRLPNFCVRRVGLPV